MASTTLAAVGASTAARKVHLVVGASTAAYVEHWAQRISAALVTADAARCLRRLPGLKQQVTAGSAARNGPRGRDT